MDLIRVVVVPIVVGILLWLVNNYIPMDKKIEDILNIVAIVAVVLWLLMDSRVPMCRRLAFRS
jgi:hypothetical protein